MMAKEKALPNQKQPLGKFDVNIYKSNEDMEANKVAKVMWKYKEDRPRGFPKNDERESILREVIKYTTKENPGTITLE